MKTENPLQPLDRLVIRSPQIISVQIRPNSSCWLIVDCDYIVLPTSTWHNCTIAIHEDMRLYVFTNTLLQADACYKAHPLEVAKAFHWSCEYMDTGKISFRDHLGRSVNWDGRFGELKC